MRTLFQIAFPHTAVLGKLPGASTVYRNVKQYPNSKLCPGILAFRIGEISDSMPYDDNMAGKGGRSL